MTEHPAVRCSLAAALLAALLVALVPAGGAAGSGVLATFDPPLEPPSTGGLERVDRALAKLEGHRRVLVVGAHPDDEDTTLLALVSRGLGGEAAYLSLSRGEGGQNLIGPELGPALGLIRSRELSAARQVDGARQYFTRAYDFGYTRSLEETLGFWPRDVLLEDAVRVIRRFRPQVVVSVFPPDERAGHGQHQAAGLAAGLAYEQAGDPGAFPALAAEGLPPWRPLALYRNTWWRGREETTLFAPAGLLDPVSGRSVFQIAMASRSRHRSQDMGMLQPLGPRDARLAWEAGGAGEAGGDLFAGVDTRLAAIAAGLPDGEARAAVAERLGRVQALAEAARADLAPGRLGEAVPRLAEMVGLLRAARRGVEALAGDGAVHAAALIAEKEAVAEAGLLAAAGVAVDATADRELAAPGDAWTVETLLWSSAGRADVELLGVELASPSGQPLSVEPAAAEERTGFDAYFLPGDEPERGFHVRTLTARLGAGAAPTVPYFLARPLDGALYDWSAAPSEVRGEPFGPPPLAARFTVRVAGVELVAEREVVHRYRDQATGEVRRPLRVVPALEVAVAPDLLVQPLPRGGEAAGPVTAGEAEPGASPARHLRVALTSRSDRELTGRLEVALPAGWELAEPPTAPAELSFSLKPFGQPGDSAEIDLAVAPTDELQPGRSRIDVAAVTADGARHALALPLVDYGHIRATPYPEPARAAVSAADVALPPLDRVGYVRGASDRVPEYLAEIGVPLVVLDPAALEHADLAVYDAIVVGSRAYEVEPALGRANPRLLDYVRGGGLLVVQYQQYPFVEGGFAPFPLDIARPHGRVTDETAPVTLLDPAHAVFHRPNEITAADWQGWVQERGLYMPATWDRAYAPLLEMKDPDQDEPQRGALLVAELGEGTWVYTGLAFFRQLPAGVPGAYRLFANLLALE
jgi:LmbE family N-acetylglucosaminyl deacetylase